MERATAALAITFDDRWLRRQLTLREPVALLRARLALQLVDRQARRRAESDVDR